MRIRSPTPARLLALLLAVAFVCATQGEALGLRHCPYHDAVPVAGHQPADASDDGASAPGSHLAAADGSHSAQHRPHPDGPCTCIQDCHVGTSQPGPASDPALLAALPATPVLPAASAHGGMLHGPRHELFELHLPNAPPLPA